MTELELGLHFILGLSGVSLSETDKKVLQIIKPAGILLFARNFDASLPYEDWIEKLKILQSEAKTYSERSNLLITIDHEGGRVIRPPSPITKFPYACYQTKRLKEITSAMALELRSIGVNLSFSPVADIHSNPLNPVIGERSFAATPEKVSEFATLCAQTLISEGIIPCGKHFPGHGDTSTDSHFTLPVLHHSLDDLDKRELIPFKALIKANIPMMMSSHISFPKIDPKFPGTLSKIILTDLLKSSLGFKGVVVSDDLNMKAVEDIFYEKETIGNAILSGLDMCTIARNPDGNSEGPITIFKNLKTHSESSPELKRTLISSEVKIRALIQQASSYEPYAVPIEILKHHEALALSCG